MITVGIQVSEDIRGNIYNNKGKVILGCTVKASSFVRRKNNFWEEITPHSLLTYFIFRIQSQLPHSSDECCFRHSGAAGDISLSPVTRHQSIF